MPVKVKQVCTNLNKPWRFQEFEAPRFHAKRQMKVVRLSALRTDHLYHPGNIPGTHCIVYLCFLQFIVKWRANPVVRCIDTKLHVQDSIFLLLALCPFLLSVQWSLLYLYLRRICPSPNCPWRIADPPAWSFDQTLIYTHSSRNSHCTNIVKIL